MSISNSFTIYHGENLFSHGPEGVQLNPASRVMYKQLLEPQNKSFQQVRCWILEMFNVDEATHRLVLRHIVTVKPKHQACPYRMVIDIVGHDSWRTFLYVSRLQAQPFVLYVQWHSKAARGPVCDGTIGETGNSTTPAPAPAPVPVPAPAPAAKEPAVGDEQSGGWPSCNKHGKPCSIETSWDRKDPGRRFYCCPLFKDPERVCGFTKWLDEEFPEKATKHINNLVSSVESLEQWVENLQRELDELRCRYVTD